MYSYKNLKLINIFWCFAIVNNRLAKIYFRREKGKVKILGHCYVKKEEFKDKQEQRWIKEDTKKHRFVFRKGIYKRIV